MVGQSCTKQEFRRKVYLRYIHHSKVGKLIIFNFHYIISYESQPTIKWIVCLEELELLIKNELQEAWEYLMLDGLYQSWALRLAEFAVHGTCSDMFSQKKKCVEAGDGNQNGRKNKEDVPSEERIIVQSSIGPLWRTACTLPICLAEENPECVWRLLG